MSFLSGIVDKGLSAIGLGKTGKTIAKVAGLALMLKQVTSSSKKKKSKSKAETYEQPDYGVREQVDPDTETSIPVVYGEAFIGGNITDAVLSDDNQTMWYCLTLCERTGIKLSDNIQSEISFEEVYWNQNKIYLQGDGSTASKFEDEDGNSSTDINGLINFYFYNNGSDHPTRLKGYAAGSSNAKSLFPNWKSTHSMENLVFCIIKVKYSKEKDVTGLGRMEFKLKNTMTQPGDCLHDYMTNERYGAGIPPEDINS